MGKVQQPYMVAWRVRVIRRVLRPIFRSLFRVLYQVNIIGQEHIPTRDAYLIAINHLSVIEPPFILAFWPVPPEAVGAAVVWERRGQATLVRLYGTIPVRRGEYDRRLIGTMLAVLESGRPLMIAPEGGRTHEPGLRRAWPGIGYLVEKARVPVVPVGVIGSSEDYLRRALRGGRPRLELRIGPVLPVAALVPNGMHSRVARQEIADRVMSSIARLLPAEYRGIYAQSLQSDTETPE